MSLPEKESQIMMIRRIITKSSKTREDLRQLYEILSSTPLNENFFKLVLAVGKSEDFLFDLCRDFKYKFFPKGQIVFEEGDEQTEYLYFIIKGKVGVFISDKQKSDNEKLESFFRMSENQKAKLDEKSKPNLIGVSNKLITSSRLFKERTNSLFKPMPQMIPLSPDFLRRSSKFEPGTSNFGKEIQPRTSSRHSLDFSSGFLKRIQANNIFGAENHEQTQMLKFVKRFFLEDNNPVTDEQIQEFKSKYGPKVRDLESWSLFGDRAIDRGKPRTATIITLTNTELIRIRQTDYQNVIKGALRAKKFKLTGFIAETLKLPQKGADFKIMFSILPSVERIKLKKGQFLVTQGSEMEMVYLVKKGEFKFTKTVSYEPNSQFYKNLLPAKIQSIFSQMYDRPVPLGFIGEHEFFGEEFLFVSNKCWEYDVECMSEKALVLAVRNHAMKGFPSRFQENWRLICEQRIQFRVRQFLRTLDVFMHDNIKFNEDLSKL